MHRFLKRGRKAPKPLATLRRKTLGNPKWRLAFYRTMASNFRARVSFAQTLTVLAEQANRRHPGGPFARILDHWAARKSRAGVELHEVLAGWVPPLEHTIIAGCEDEKGLERVIWYLQKQLATGKTAKIALVYPSLMVVTLFVAIYVIGNQILPSIYAQTQAGEDHTVTLLVTRYAWLIFLPFIAFAALITLTMTTWVGDARTWFDLHLWPWTLWRRRQGHAFLFAFSTLIKAKTELAALNALTANATPWHRQRISGIAYYVMEGLSFAEGAREAGHGFPDPALIDTLEAVKASQEDMAVLLSTFAEEASNAEDEKQNIILMIVGLSVMILTILAVLALGVALVNSFDLTGMAGAMRAAP